LYAYLHELLVKSMLENRAEPLNEAVKVLTELRGAWSEVATLATPLWEKNQAEAALSADTSETRDAGRLPLKA
jgi:flagellin-specific chaperone FliS